MKSYFLMILGAAVLSALSSVMAPEKWRGYIRLVTGVVILACAASPIMDLLGSGGGFNIPETRTAPNYNENAYRDAVADELKSRIDADIEARMEREYGVKIIADADIKINEKNEIEGVERITVRGALSTAAKRELCDIYGVETIYEK